MDRGRGKWRTWWFYIPVIAVVVAGLLLGNQAVTVISESIVPDRGVCIIIDAGHGGEDGGATSCTGMLESRFNLEIALRLNDLLHFLGYETKMIRTTDISVYTEGETIAARKRSDLNQRLKLIDETEDALVLSIHQNFYPDSRYGGAQVFYPDTQGSQELARLLQSAFVSTVNPGSNRQIKQTSGVYLMEHINCPGVLIECGFLSNPEEEARLRDEEYQRQLCCVIAATVATYISNT